MTEHIANCFLGASTIASGTVAESASQREIHSKQVAALRNEISDKNKQLEQLKVHIYSCTYTSLMMLLSYLTGIITRITSRQRSIVMRL